MASAGGATAAVAAISAAAKPASSDQPETSAPASARPLPLPGRVSLSPESKTQAPNETNAAVDGNGKLTVCRFLVQQLKGGAGYAKSDFRIDFIRERHGLYDLVSSVFDIMHSERLTHDRITSHLWNVELAGRRYANGWRRVNPMTMEPERPAGPRDVDELERRVFSSLATPLESGQKGSCGGESLSFDFVVESIAAEEVSESDIDIELYNPWEIFQRPDPENEQGPPETPKSKAKVGVPKYPRSAKVALRISGDLLADWLDAETKQRVASLRLDWSTYFSGMNTWKKDRRTREYIPAKPDSPPWGGDEIEVIGLLSNSGAKFKKSWTNIMQYAFPNRSESACSMKWYALRKKEHYMIERVGRGMTNDARVRLAKRLAARRTRDLLERGCAARDPHPDERIAARLRKRGKIDDGTDEAEKKRLCREYRWMDHCSSDSDADY